LITPASTDRLTGFNDEEVERMALVARYHRKSEPRPKHPEFAALSDASQQEVRVLAGLLRVAIGLDRNHAARVASVGVKDKGDRVVLRVAPAPGEDVSLELYAAASRRGLLETALDTTVELREVARREV
jgi:exopolyphosphatase/guanosine-5'-triphosphate,3'-diphosphate pyrophosphatase